MNIPENFLYTKDHEWVMLKSKEVLVGITEFAQQELDDIVEIETVGESLQQGDVFGTEEAVKTVSNLLLPIEEFICELA